MYTYPSDNNHNKPVLHAVHFFTATVNRVMWSFLKTSSRLCIWAYTAALFSKCRKLCRILQRRDGKTKMCWLAELWGLPTYCNLQYTTGRSTIRCGRSLFSPVSLIRGHCGFRYSAVQSPHRSRTISGPLLQGQRTAPSSHCPFPFKG